MAGSCKYDDKGAQFVTFVIRVLCLVLVPLTQLSTITASLTNKIYDNSLLLH